MSDETLFSDALALGDLLARQAFLEKACSDLEQRQRVAELLAAVGGTNPLDRPPLDLGKTGAYSPETVDREPTAAVGDRVGPYKLLEKIGEGGMGEVWVADQLEPIKRRVALKLIKPGMDSRSVLGRFEAERQALAVMDHPNIAKVLDAGYWSPSPLAGEGLGVRGAPYFVMELVKGTPITEFCDARKLTPKQRLELFVPVCQAIQHAHMKGIIHRDIKPSNVLVALHDETPVPKVIDFGVAKAVGQQLTEKTIYTGFGALVGTPAYMAPEQATFNQLDVDTRADVYALGVLLYELLAGSPPIEKERLKLAALDEVLRIVRDEEPPRPSQRLSTSQAKANIAATRQSDPAKLSALMKGEIDWIVMKALEKDRTRRYETANGFAADVQRYLCGEQVQAVPPSFGYRLKKAYRRNKTAVRVVSAFVCLALGTAVMGAYLAVRATSAERKAEDERDVAREAQRKEGERADGEARAKVEADRERFAAVAARDTARRTYYAAQMNLADAANKAENGARCVSILDEFRPAPGEPDLRGPEWYYLYRRWNTADTTVRISEASLDNAQLFGPHGTTLIEFPRDQLGQPLAISVFDTATGRRVYRQPIPEQGSDSIRGGKRDTYYRVSSSADSGVIVHKGKAFVTAFEPATGKVRYRARRDIPPSADDPAADPQFVNEVYLSGDGRRLILSSVSRIQQAGVRGIVATEQVIDMASGELLRRRDGPFAATAVSHDGTLLVLTDGKDTLLVEETDTGKEVARFSTAGAIPAEVQEEVPRGWDLKREVGLTPDNEKLICALSPPFRLKPFSRVLMWNVKTGKRLDADTNFRPFSGPVGDGEMMLSARVNVVDLVKTRTGDILHTFRMPETVYEVAFDPTKNRVFARTENGVVRSWAVPDTSPAQNATKTFRTVLARSDTDNHFVELLQEEGAEHVTFRLHHPTAGQVVQSLRWTAPTAKFIDKFGASSNVIRSFFFGQFDTTNRRVLFLAGTAPSDGKRLNSVGPWAWELGENRFVRLGDPWPLGRESEVGKVALAMRLSPNGITVVTARTAVGEEQTEHNKQQRLRFVSPTGQMLGESEWVNGSITDLAFTPDERCVVAAYTVTDTPPDGFHHRVATFDLATGRRQSEIGLVNFKRGPVDGISTTLGGGRVIYLQSPIAPRANKDLPRQDRVSNVVPPIACVVCDSGTGRELYRFTRPGLRVLDARATPDGQRLAVVFIPTDRIDFPAAELDAKPCVAVHNLNDGRMEFDFPIALVSRTGMNYPHVRFTHGGQRLVLFDPSPSVNLRGSAVTVEVRHGTNGRPLIELPLPNRVRPASVRSSPDGSRWVFETSADFGPLFEVPCGPMPEPKK